MLNLSQLARTLDQVPLIEKAKDIYFPEVYKAENIADYKASKSSLLPPWFKRNPLLDANYYAYILFYNVGIHEIIEGDELIGDAVQVHDSSGSEVMLWTTPGELFPANKSYFQMLDDRELELDDFVFRLAIRHSYEGSLPFISEVEKRKQSKNIKDEHSLIERILSLIPNIEPDFELAYQMCS